jgi:uncharacterized membrane-anchored protein
MTVVHQGSGLLAANTPANQGHNNSASPAVLIGVVVFIAVVAVWMFFLRSRRGR